MKLQGLAVAVCILTVSATATAQTEWIEFANREDGFSANFPGQPTITETTYKSQFGADLPARVYSAVDGRSRYSLTVVDYNQVERLLTERSKSCPPGAEVCKGNTAATSSTGAGYWKVDLAGAVIYATWQFLQRDAKVTDFLWNNIDFVEGQQIQLTNNKDQSRTAVAIYMHENKLYIVEGTVPAGYPEPGLFQQSLQWIDETGKSFRYRSLYHNGLPVPPKR